MKKLGALAGSVLLFWALFVPALEFPDEQAHFASVAMLAETSAMPKGEQKDVSRELATLETTLGTVRDERGNNKYTYHPENKHLFSGDVYGPKEQEILEANTAFNRSSYLFKEGARYPALFYKYAGIFYKSVYEKSILDRLFMVRVGVVILGILNVYLAFKIGQEITGVKYLSWCLAMLVALQPMMTFVMSGVNSDALHNCLFSGILLYCLRFIKHKHAADSLFYIGIFFILDLITKPQAYIALPIIAIACIFRMLYQQEIKSTLSYILPILLIGVGYLYVSKNALLMDFMNKGKIPYIKEDIHPEAPAFMTYAKYSLERLVQQNIVWFWGVFKWLGVVLPKPFWWFANRIILVSVVGLGIGFFKNYTKEQKIFLSFLALSVVTYIGAIFMFDWMYIRSHGVQVAVQARYYFPVFTALMSLLYMGLLGFSSNQKYRRKASQALMIFFIILQFGGIYTIAKYYYDLSTIKILFLQASQYKPLFVKGATWWLWCCMYLAGMGSIIRLTFKKSD